MTMANTNTGVPLTPLEGTADPNPLVSYQQYTAMTGDTVSDQADVEDAIDDAIDMVCNECTRTLLYAQYQEDQYLYDNGMVFPSAVPIDPTKQISSNEVIYNPTTDDAPGSIIQGWGVWVGWFTPLPWMPVFSGVLPPQTNITYWGGYTQSTLPPKLRRLIIRIAFKSLLANNNSLAGIPGGASSASVSGSSASGSMGLSSFSLSDAQIKRDLRRFKRPQVEAWQS